MYTFSVLGGDFPASVGKCEVQGPFLYFNQPRRLFRERVLASELEEVEVLGDGTEKSFGGAAAAGLGGGLLLGGVGAVAGLLAGGNRKTVTFRLAFRDGRSCVCSGRLNVPEELQRARHRGRGLWLAAHVLVGVVIVVALIWLIIVRSRAERHFAGESTSDTPTPAPQPSAEPEPEEQPYTTAEIGAIATLSNLVIAQALFQSTARADEDNDGVGEYGTLAELAGVVGVRGGSSLNPPVLTRSLGRGNEHGLRLAPAPRRRAASLLREQRRRAAGVRERPLQRNRRATVGCGVCLRYEHACWGSGGGREGCGLRTVAAGAIAVSVFPFPWRLAQCTLPGRLPRRSAVTQRSRAPPASPLLSTTSTVTTPHSRIIGNTSGRFSRPRCSEAPIRGLPRVGGRPHPR